MNETKNLKVLRLAQEPIDRERTTRTIMTVDGPASIERAAFQLHTALTFNLRRYLGSEVNEPGYEWANLSWRQICEREDMQWVREWFERSAEDFACYLDFERTKK